MHHRKTGLVDLLRVTNPLSAVNSTTPLDFRASGLSGSGLVLLAARRVVRTARGNYRKQGFSTCKHREARASRQERLHMRMRDLSGSSGLDSPPLECWCLSSAKFALSSVGILQIDGVFRCVSRDLQLLFPIFRGTTLKGETTQYRIHKKRSYINYSK